MARKAKSQAKSKSDGVGPKTPDSSGQDGRPGASAEDTTQASDQIENRPLQGNQTAEIMVLDKIAQNKSIKQTTITVWATRVDNGQRIQVVVEIADNVKVYHDGKLFAER